MLKSTLPIKTPQQVNFNYDMVNDKEVLYLREVLYVFFMSNKASLQPTSISNHGSIRNCSKDLLYLQNF